MKHTRLADAIVTRTALAIAPDGREFTLTLSIGRPYPTREMEWACPVELEPLYPRLLDQRGVDSWQAFQLCYRLILQLLAGLEQDGGTLYWPNEREPMRVSEFVPTLPE